MIIYNYFLERLQSKTISIEGFKMNALKWHDIIISIPMFFDI